MEMESDMATETAEKKADRLVEAQGDVVYFHKRYARLLLLTVLVVIGVLAALMVWQDIRYERSDTDRLQQHFDEYVHIVNGRFSQLWHEMLELQASSQATLFESRNSRQLMPYSFRFLKGDPQGRAFHLDDVGPPLVKTDIGNLTGDGTIKGRSNDFYREIAMALRLMVDFDSLSDTIPNLEWIYYYSRDYFAVYYPWTPSVKTRFEKASYQLSAWSLGLPENNPRRAPYWTETYFDSVGKGLMVSCLVPVYDENQFAGVIGADLSVDFINDLVTDFEPGRKGLFVLYDQFDNLIAYPRQISASDKKISQLTDGLPPALAFQVKRLKSLPEGRVEEIGDWRVLVQSLKKTPYTALYAEPIPSRIVTIIERAGVGTIGLSLVLILLLMASLTFTHFQFVRPSAKFVEHILLRSRDKHSELNREVPPDWQPWFSIISRVFDEHTELTRGLAAKNKEFQAEIDDRQQAQEALRISEIRYREMFDHMSDGVAVYQAIDEGADFVFLDINRPGALITQAEKKDIIGKPVSVVFPGVKEMGLLAVFQRVWQTGKPEFHPMSQYEDSRIALWVDNYVYKLPGGEIVAVYNDITEKKKVEQELENYRNNLEVLVEERTAEVTAISQELEDFVYSVSHDLRAPLRSINGFSSIIARRHQTDLDEQASHYFDNIIRATEHMGALIDELLSYSRIGRTELKTGAVSLNDMLVDILDNLHGRVEEKQASILIPEGLPNVEADRNALSSVFTNLLDNALTYHSQGKPPEIQVNAEIKGNRAIISVSDKGIGIPTEHQEKIFNIFQRLHAQDIYPGTGIGLAIVKKSVERMNGRIWVDSTPGTGSTFTIDLPAT
jgi:signal transduction histidine kinase